MRFGASDVWISPLSLSLSLSLSVCVRVETDNGNNTSAISARTQSHIFTHAGAVDPSVGAKRVLFEVAKIDEGNTGTFINCEDGLQIPW